MWTANREVARWCRIAIKALLHAAGCRPRSTRVRELAAAGLAPAAGACGWRLWLAPAALTAHPEADRLSRRNRRNERSASFAVRAIAASYAAAASADLPSLRSKSARVAWYRW